MGAWGFHSDENDDTADALWLSIEQRINGVRLDTQEIEAVSRAFARDVVGNAKDEALPGVVRWGLRNGIRIAQKTLRRAARILKVELAPLEAGENTRRWDDPRARARAIKSELKAIEHALENGGYGRKGKTHGIASALKRVVAKAWVLPPGSRAIALGERGLGPWAKKGGSR